MAHQEACQLFIEQEIKEGLAEGKTPTVIGKEINVWVEKLFETSIPPETIRSRARFIKKRGGEITTPPTTPLNPPQIPEKPPNQQEDKLGKGKTRGSGRPPKHAAKKPPPPPEPYTDAVYFADIAIGQLEKIKPRPDSETGTRIR